MTQPYHQRNQEATIWCGNLDAQSSEELIFELFLQVGPVTNVNMPRDKITNLHQGYAFVEFESAEDAEYAIRCMNLVKLYGKPMRVNMAAKDKKQEEFNANLFVGNLDTEIDEKALYETFSRFGCVISCKIMTEDTSSKSRGFGFVTFDSFDSADLALNAMNGQWLGGRTINVSYAFKKDGSKGERHGSEEERKLESNRKRTMPAAPPKPMMLMQFATNSSSTPSPASAAAARSAPPPQAPAAGMPNAMNPYGMMNPLMGAMPHAMNPMMSMMGLGQMGSMAGQMPPQFGSAGAAGVMPRPPMFPSGPPGGAQPPPPQFPPAFPPLPGANVGGAPSFPPQFPPAPGGPGGMPGYPPQFPRAFPPAFPPIPTQ